MVAKKNPPQAAFWPGSKEKLCRWGFVCKPGASKPEGKGETPEIVVLLSIRSRAHI